MIDFTIFINFVLHIDQYLNIIVQKFGLGTYIVLFTIIFAETGFVFTPFLPGDSLIFVAGTFASQGILNVFVLFLILSLAAVLGDSINYSIGKFLGPRVFKEKSKYFKKEYLLKTETFYEKHGAKTIILARFIPIIRTFAPFVAGIGKMDYFKFLGYNVFGAFLWVGLFAFGGYFFGNISFVQENFSLVILVIILTSFIPGIIEFIKHKMKKKHI